MVLTIALIIISPPPKKEEMIKGAKLALCLDFSVNACLGPCLKKLDVDVHLEHPFIILLAEVSCHYQPSLPTHLVNRILKFLYQPIW